MTSASQAHQDYRRLVVASIGVALTALLIVMVVQRWLSERDDLVTSIAAQASIVAANASTAVMADDDQDARATLLALGTSPVVLEAALYRADGSMLTSYTSPALFGERPLTLRAPELGVQFSSHEALVTAPVMHHKRTVGRITVWVTQDPVFKELWNFLAGLLVTSLVVAVFAYLATTGLRQRLTAARRQVETTRSIMDQLSARREQLFEEEHRRIAIEIHDQIGQVITASLLNLRLLERSAGNVADEIGPLVQEIEGQLNAAYKGIKDIATTLHPVVLNFGLTTALEWLGERMLRSAGILFRITAPETSVVLEPREALAVFRIVQEAFSNIVRHAQATVVDITITDSWSHFVLEVADNGVGFDTEHPENAMSLGLLGMRQRAESIGAQAEVDSKPGKGTRVRVTLARNDAAAGGIPQ